MGRSRLHPRRRSIAAFERRLWTLLLCGLAWCVCTLDPPAASAAPSATAKETARSLMDEGDQLMAKGELTGALKRYAAAHQIMGVPTTGIEVARVQEKLGLLVEARATAIEVANSQVSAKEPEVFAEARAAAVTLASSLERRIATITIDVGPADADTTTKLGDSDIPQAALGLPYKVNPGRHVLTITAPGYAAQEMDFEMAEGEERVLRMVLAKDNSIPPGPVPAAEPALVPTATPERAKQDQVKPDARGTEADGSIATQTWVAFGVAAASGLVGGGAGVYSLLKTNDAKERCDANVCPASVSDDIDNAKTMAWVANIGLGVAVLAAGYGVYTLLSDDDSGETSDMGGLGVAISPRADSAALTWTGAF
jgi:hypothetical protein